MDINEKKDILFVDDFVNSGVPVLLVNDLSEANELLNIDKNEILIIK